MFQVIQVNFLAALAVLELRNQAKKYTLSF
jgi:hypothetical protein